jgi:hypothetical protein
MEFDYPHNLTSDEVRERLDCLGAYLRNRHGIDVSWDGDDRAIFKGRYLVIGFEGVMTFEDKLVRFKGKDPGRLWRKKATNYIRGKLETYFDPRTPVEELLRR